MKYGATTRLSPERVLEKAKDYFGKLELTVQEESARELMLKNDAGYVQIKIEEVHGVELDIETKGFDQQVKQFLQRIG